MEADREYFLSWSGGADSTATALLAMEHGEPLTALVYCEVMFDEQISAEVPEHAEFIHIYMESRFDLEDRQMTWEDYGL